MNAIFNKKMFFLTITLITFFFGPYGDSNLPAIDRDTYKGLKTFSEVLDMVQKNYVEPVSADKLLHGAVNGMIKTLDPHSSFMTKEMYKELEVETRGSFGGIGIEITIVKDVLTVVSPIEDTPAYRAGVKAGDQIIKINGDSTKDITIMEAVKKLRGPKGTKVTITVLREGMVKSEDITINRDIIKIKSVKSKIYKNNIGYIRIASFQEHTGDDLRRNLTELKAKAHPLNGLVVDLRTNPGGLLHQSIEVADAFLKKGIIVTTRGRSEKMESKAEAKDDGEEPTCPIIVLVNEGTASAAEIVSGALQDNKRAIVLGRQTFGKASVQTVIPLDDGSALRLTTAKYYTPNGRSIQAEGIAPDIVVKQIKQPQEKGTEDSSAEKNVLREKDLKGHIKSLNEKNIKNGEEKRAEEVLENDNQLKSAIDIIRGLNVLKN